jgi:hypothetical protein
LDAGDIQDDGPGRFPGPDLVIHLLERFRGSPAGAFHADQGQQVRHDRQDDGVECRFVQFHTQGDKRQAEQVSDDQDKDGFE